MMAKQIKSISAQFLNNEVIVQGWIQKIRNLGKIIFLDLRTKFGIVQILIRKKDNLKLYLLVKTATIESVVEVIGTLIKRKNPNLKIKNGTFEIIAKNFKIINYAKNIPFLINDPNKNISEDTKLKFRYLDLRNDNLHNNLKFKSQFIFLIYQFMIKNHFINITTPILNRFTPEGAKDFLVVNDFQNNSYFALPQSPQLFKQLLMISGFDRYFQIAHCFRDENLRSNRQPEFLQLDLEMSFVKAKDVMNLINKLIKFLCKQLQLPNFKIKSINYQSTIQNYGIDHPDTRFLFLLKDLNHIFVGKEKKFTYRGFLIPNFLNSKEITRLKTVAKQNNLTNLYFLKIINYKIVNQDLNLDFQDQYFLSLTKIFNIDSSLNYTLIVGYDMYNVVCQALGYIRHKYIEIKKLKSNLDFEFLWIKKWPLFKENNDGSITYHHHPFTRPSQNSINYLLTTDFKKLKKTKLMKLGSDAYDLVLNGQEIGSGSIRIENKNLQIKILNILGWNNKQIKDDFQWFLDAFDYGVPIHGGIALGIERWVMSFKNIKAIKDVVAFPKNNKKLDLLAQSPVIIKKD